MAYIKNSEFIYQDGLLTISEDCNGCYDFNESLEYLDVEEKKEILRGTREIVIPGSWEIIDEELWNFVDEDNQITCLNLTHAIGLSEMCVSSLDKLRVAVLPKQIEDLTNVHFYDDPSLEEVHIYCLDRLDEITSDKDKRLTLYVSKLSDTFEDHSDSSDNLYGINYSDNFLKDVKKVYLPAEYVRFFEFFLREQVTGDVDIEICPLPDGYSYPEKALSEPINKTY